MPDENKGGFEVNLFLELNNFDKTEIFKDSRLRNSLISDLPWQFILSERIICIFYIDREMTDDKGSTIYGHYEEGGENGQDTLYVYKQPEGKVENKEKRPFMRHAIYHEIAHSVYFRLRNKARQEWISLIKPDKSESFIRQKVRSPQEDFAECFAFYIQNPDRLKDVSHEKYIFLKLHVFACREYPEYKFLQEENNDY